jgi:hypothetical protein
MYRCSICLDDVSDCDNVRLECHHLFHTECVTQLRSDKCPLCRKPIKSSVLTEKQLNVMRKRYSDDTTVHYALISRNFDRVISSYYTFLSSIRQNVPKNPEDLIYILVYIVRLHERLYKCDIGDETLFTLILTDMQTLYPLSSFRMLSTIAQSSVNDI